MNAQPVTYRAQSSYCMSGSISATTKEIWFVLHGYGQLARDFIKPFCGQQAEDTCIIAPQGQSLFYLRGFTGPVGASWLTAEDRDTGIQNQLAYLDAVYEHALADVAHSPDVYLLGFSQGAATVSRWAASSTFPFKALVLWAGHPAHDIPQHVVDRRLKGPKTVVLHGMHDHLITATELRAMKKKVHAMGLDPVYLEYEGGHEVTAEQFGLLAQGMREGSI